MRVAQSLYLLRRHRLTGIGIPIINLRRSDDRLRFTMGIPVAKRLLAFILPVVLLCFFYLSQATRLCGYLSCIYKKSSGFLLHDFPPKWSDHEGKNRLVLPTASTKHNKSAIVMDWLVFISLNTRSAIIKNISRNTIQRVLAHNQ